jgi:Tfp pilus assembly protein PilO
MNKLDLKKLTPREKTILVVMTLVVVGLGFFKLEHEVREEKIKKITSQINKTNTALNSLAKTIPAGAKVKNIEKKIAKLNEKNAQLKKDIKFAKSRMRGSYLEILNAMNAEAEKSKAILKSTKTTDEEIKKGKLKYKEVTVTMVIHSDYKAIASFIEGLEKIPAIIFLDTIEVKRKDEFLPNIQTKLTLKLYALV